MKIQVKKKPATKARKGINPFTGEKMTFKAKPNRNVVKVYPLKKIKDMFFRRRAEELEWKKGPVRDGIVPCGPFLFLINKMATILGKSN